jgi:hypothetical protein
MSELDRLARRPMAPTAAPAAVSHGTQVEQSRAVAEVFAAAELAARFPRDEERAEAAMLRACSRTSMAESASYALPRGQGKEVTGPSVHLARELARIWGNITHGVVEISRGAGQSELTAYAWDVEANARSARTVIIPHTRDKTVWESVNGKNKRTGTAAEPLDVQQDITNQNNSVGARQLREVIFSVLPKWFTEDAVAACAATLVANEQSGARDAAGFAARVQTAISAFEGNGVTRRQVEDWAGPRAADWTPETLARVGVLYRSLQSGQTTVQQAFGRAGATVDDLPPAPAPDPAPDTEGKPLITTHPQVDPDDIDPTDPDYRGGDYRPGTEQ